jgi:type I restriction enzyme, S subunit
MTFVHDIEALVASSSDALLIAHPSWERVPLGCVAAVQNGAAFKSSRFGTAKGIPLIRIRDLGRTSTTCLYDGPYDPVFLVQPGDLLVGMDGEFRVARWTGRPGLLNQRVCRVVVRPEYYDGRFLELILQGYLDAIHKSTSSQTVTHLSSRTIESIPLPLPPLAEQHRIVAGVNALLAEGTAAHTHLAKALTALKRLRQAALVAACSGRLTERWRSGEDVAPDGDAPPASWHRTTIGDLVKVATGATPLRKRVDYYRGGTIPWVTSGAVNQSLITQAEECITKTALRETNAKIFPPGTLLVAMYGEGATRGKVAELGIAAATNQAVAALLFDQTSIDLKPFLKLTLQSQYMQHREAAAGGVQPNLSLGAIRAISVAIPAEAERREIIDRIDTLLSLADRIDEQVTVAKNRLDYIARSFVAKALRGELVPTEAELARQEARAFEPASELLQRILAASGALRKTRRVTERARHVTKSTGGRRKARRGRS